MKKDCITLFLVLVLSCLGLCYRVNNIVKMRNAELRKNLVYHDTTTSLVATVNKDKSNKYEKRSKIKEVTITKYHPVKSQTDDNPLQTADLSEISMTKLYKGKIKWVAVSRDLLKEYGYGSKIRISTGDPDIDGVYEVHDTMNPRFMARVDILSHPKHELGKGLWTGNIRKF